MHHYSFDKQFTFSRLHLKKHFWFWWGHGVFIL